MMKTIVDCTFGKTYNLEITKIKDNKNYYVLSEETIKDILYTVIFKTEDIECLESYLRTKLVMDNKSIKELKTKEKVRYY